MPSSPTTASLAARVTQQEVPPGHVIAWWLGGSGFLFKIPAGTQVCVDPYLSNIVEDIFGAGNRRGFPTPLPARDVRADAVISTHWHQDQLHPGANPLIA